MTTLNTERLILRPWKPSDYAPFADMNADPEVMEFFPKTLTPKESNAYAEKFAKHIEENGWGLWAVTAPEAEFIGFIGLTPVGFEAPFTPATEVGWRLARPFWGKGYATEGAKAAMEYGFSQLGLQEIVSFTTVENARSQKVMEKLQMTHDPDDDFDHPTLPEGHPLRRHVLYRIKL